MAHVNSMSVFDVERIVIRWVAEHNSYTIRIEGGGGDRILINAWPGTGEGPAPELIVESWPPSPPPEDKPDPVELSVPLPINPTVWAAGSPDPENEELDI